MAFASNRSNERNKGDFSVDLKEFSDQIFAVQHAILDQLFEYPLQSQPPAPKDWPELRSIVRKLAEDLMLCADVNEAIARLRQDQATALDVVWLTNYAVSEDDSLLAIKRAHADTLHEPTILPLHAFCSYLIELCDGLELESSKA